ncbi:MAG: C40 family peptidase [Elusimicrobiales bacterium]|nr:C40 family peptidase [Elusimicrobiales bacterium]
MKPLIHALLATVLFALSARAGNFDDMVPSAPADGHFKSRKMHVISPMSNIYNRMPGTKPAQPVDPDEGSPDGLVSQAFMGEDVEVSDLRGRFAKVRLDGHESWMKAGDLADGGMDCHVNSRVGSVSAAADVKGKPLELFMGTGVCATGKTSGERSEIRLGNGQTGWINTADLMPQTEGEHADGAYGINSSNGNQNSSGNDGGTNTAVEQARKFKGVPYVWGGTSKNGIDCSGLTSVAYRSAGKSIPRTAHEQFKSAQQIKREELQPGDLIFLGSTAKITHVIMYTGDDNVIEAARPSVTEHGYNRGQFFGRVGDGQGGGQSNGKRQSGKKRG